MSSINSRKTCIHAGGGASRIDQVESQGGLAEGRVVLLCGQAVRQLGGPLNDLLCQMGIAPAVVAAPVERHFGVPLSEAVQQMREAHAR